MWEPVHSSQHSWSNPMVSNRRQRNRRSSDVMESLESRTLMSASVAIFTMQAPAGVTMVQTDQNATGSAAAGPGASLNSAIDVSVRTLAGGVAISVAVSSTQIMTLAPTGTVDLFDNLKYIGTVKLGGNVRSTLVLGTGKHELSATYAGDANFLPSQTTATKLFTVPTGTANPQVSSLTKPTTAKGTTVRPVRLLSKINYFDAHNLTVSAIPTQNGTPVVAAQPAPVVRFARVSFSMKLPVMKWAI